MIIVQGWVRLDEGELDRLHDVAITMMEETRKEEGCIAYTFSRAMEDPNLMRIAEVWEDQASLDAHGKSPHMATFNQSLGSAKILGISIKAYPAEAGKTLMGAD
ncbi:antibiotic biosynthesis monooxygenase [Parasphingopyxis sp. CP4]|uniref:putative quinol monooxygenase n=1 Tax=Parasphingopyxis sp. CP4 TaxID=2724527 RepID=UPI0015A18826|nr:putative quinol monooxygenase [Parasphingopyxis sp. CP4]QLC22215.1 antibiotic biosynthesis monooxygenase [Parasphingopyxis sp. CP4]